LRIWKNTDTEVIVYFYFKFQYKPEVNAKERVRSLKSVLVFFKLQGKKFLLIERRRCFFKRVVFYGYDRVILVSEQMNVIFQVSKFCYESCKRKKLLKMCFFQKHFVQNTKYLPDFEVILRCFEQNEYRLNKEKTID